ncbi:hypothetical protein ZWY2020_054933, partial [Hordeum vulgare]
MATEAAPEWLEKGDNAWQLAAAALVGLQSVPGLVILYGSIVKKKWAVNSAFMALYAFAATMVCWCLWGFRMSFGDRLLPFVGRPDFAGLDSAGFLAGQGFAGATRPPRSSSSSSSLPPSRSSSVWSPNGFLFAGVMDFAGGYVIHLSSGIAGFTAAFWVGLRTAKDREAFPPNNILLTLAGAGLLWMGWTGFNGGAPYAANIDASVAVVNTHLCTATSLLVWLIRLLVFGRPSVIGAVQGMITGLVCITPGAGLVQGWAAMLMGLRSRSVPWFTMM